MLLGFHLRHPQQIGEQIEMMALGQPRQRRERLHDERHGLVGTAVI